MNEIDAKNIKYKKDDLLDHVDKLKANIKTFEVAINKEKHEIERTLQMISILDAHK